jgi:hypothetical protein
MLDLLPDRRAETLGDWLKRHSSIEIIAPDRPAAMRMALAKVHPKPCRSLNAGIRSAISAMPPIDHVDQAWA